MTTDAPPPKIGLCEHGRVRTLCATCREALADARLEGPRASSPWGRAYRRLTKDVPEARVPCATCQERGSSRAFVEDVDAKRFLCRKHAATLVFAHVAYSTAGRVVEAAAPSPSHWNDVLADSRATSIRAFTRAPKP